MATARPSTPPRTSTQPTQAQSPQTPEQIRRLEANRLKAKALREQREGESARNGSSHVSSSNLAAGQKRDFATYATGNPSTNRDARSESNIKDRPLEAIRPARNFAKYVEYDFSKMTDTKGGFLTAEDDPHNKAMQHAQEQESRPPQLTQGEWERQQLLKSLRNDRAGPFAPGISAIVDVDTKRCRECRSMEVDWKWCDIFDVAVCSACKDKYPEKYSLLTKTECKDDYLLTDPELKDEKLLPHLEKPNPHKANWHSMYLYLRLQVEEYAFSDQKWGSPEVLDAEYERRKEETKRRKETKFKSKLADLKKRTRVEAYQRSINSGPGGVGEKHVHEFGQAIDNPDTGMPVKKCVECGFEVEELDL